MEQRKYPRVDIETEALIRNGANDFRGTLRNISLCGIYVSTESRIPLGASAEVIFAATLPSRKGAVKVQGKVVRTDDEGIAFSVQNIDVDSFINLHLIVAKRAATS